MLSLVIAEIPQWWFLAGLFMILVSLNNLKPRSKNEARWGNKEARLDPAKWIDCPKCNEKYFHASAGKPVWCCPKCGFNRQTGQQPSLGGGAPAKTKLGKCPDCEREISLKANSCPHCGRPKPFSKDS